MRTKSYKLELLALASVAGIVLIAGAAVVVEATKQPPVPATPTVIIETMTAEGYIGEPIPMKIGPMIYSNWGVI